MALAIAGLGAAVAIGLAANSISGDSVGLSAQPLSAGETLAPASAAQGKARDRRQRPSARRRERQASGTDSTPANPAPRVIPSPPATEPGDDHGGDDNSGPGGGGGSDDNSGSGSSGSSGSGGSDDD